MNAYRDRRPVDRSVSDTFAFGGKPERPALAIRLLAFRPMTKGQLRGFARVQIGGLILEDYPVQYCSNGRLWCALPSKPQLDAAGQPIVDARGKKQYVAILKWSTRELADTFSADVIAAIRRLYPDALAEERHLDV